MNAEIIAVLTPERLKELLASAQTLETSANTFCYCCFTKKGTLHSYALKTFALMNAFEVQFITVCYICKELAQQAEKFIQKVQSNQSFFIAEDNAELSEPYNPLKRLVKCNQEQIDIKSVEFEQIVEQSGESQKDADLGQVKSEVEESHGDDDEQLLHEEKIICDDGGDVDGDADDVDGDADDVDGDADDIKAPDKSSNGDPLPEDQHNIKKLLAGKIKRFYINKKQVMAERDEKARKPSFVAAKYKCPLCIQTMSSWIRLSNHMDMFHSLQCGPFECDVCRRRKYTETGLKTHRISHFKRYKCVECGAIASNCVAAKSHYIKEHAHNPNLYSCNLCKRPFTSKIRLRLHMRRHANGENAMCKYCNTYPRCLSIHLKCCFKKEEIKRKRLMSKINPFFCAVCDRNFTTHAGFNRHSNSNRHLEKLNGKMNTKFKCDYCGREYKEKGFLRNHIFSIHMNMYKLPCKLCSRKFYCHFTLGRHVKRMHEVSCERCAETFNTKESLQEHRLKIHQGEKLFACKACNIDFAEYKALFDHDNTVHRKCEKLSSATQDF